MNRNFENSMQKGDFPFKLQEDFRVPETAKLNLDKKENNSVIDENSFMGYNEVSLRDDDHVSQNDAVVSKNQLDDKVRRNLEKYEFNF